VAKHRRLLPLGGRGLELLRRRNRLVDAVEVRELRWLAKKTRHMGLNEELHRELGVVDEEEKADEEDDPGLIRSRNLGRDGLDNDIDLVEAVVPLRALNSRAALREGLRLGEIYCANAIIAHG